MMIDSHLAEREMKLNTEEALASAEQARLRRLAKGHGGPRRRRLTPALQSLKDFWMRQRLVHQGVQVDPTITADHQPAPVWKYHLDDLHTVRDCDRLPNGNTLMVGILRVEEFGEDVYKSLILEVKPTIKNGRVVENEIVWRLVLEGCPVPSNQPGWFHKAQRIPLSACTLGRIEE